MLKESFVILGNMLILFLAESDERLDNTFMNTKLHRQQTNFSTKTAKSPYQHL